MLARIRRAGLLERHHDARELFWADPVPVSVTISSIPSPISASISMEPPTAFFTSRVENDEADLFDGDRAEEEATEEDREELSETWNRRKIKDCPDLPQLAKTVLPHLAVSFLHRGGHHQ
jgi:hypothetical protein